MFNFFSCNKSPLFPPIEPYATHMLDVGDGHTIYVEESGNPKGQPIVYCHGGPGAATKAKDRQLFDPKRYRIILFDQRGCGQSTPAHCIEHNTTQHLIADMERIRAHLNIDTWHVFGGSWGSTLALAYAQEHQEPTKSLLIYGIFTARQNEMDGLYGKDGVAAQLYPEIFEPYKNFLPKKEQNDILGNYIKRISTQTGQKKKETALAFTAWEMNLLSLVPDETEIAKVLNPETFDMSYAIINLHYFKNKCFFKEGQLLKGMKKIQHIPLTIIQGRYDVVCPPKTAWEIAQAHGNARLEFSQMAGHSKNDGETTKKLIQATNAHLTL